MSTPERLFIGIDPGVSGATERAGILALDCATRTGWASRRQGGESAASGHYTLRNQRNQSDGWRFREFTNWLQRQLDELWPEIVVFEQPMGRQISIAQVKLSYGLTTRVEEAAAARSLDYRGVSPTALKLWATGKGNAGKPEMVAAAAERFGRDAATLDDNEADALLLLAYAEAGFPAVETKAARVKRETAARKAGA